MRNEMEVLMENTVDTFDDKVDYFLHRIATAPTLTLSACTLYEVPYLDEEMYLVDQVMIEKGLIKMEKERRIITGKGLEIANFGGWIMYQKLLKKDKVNRFTEQESLVRKYQKDIATLRRQIAQLESEVISKKEREVTAYMVIRNLIQQNKNNKVVSMLWGAVSGFALAAISWVIFMR